MLHACERVRSYAGSPSLQLASRPEAAQAVKLAPQTEYVEGQKYILYVTIRTLPPAALKPENRERGTEDTTSSSPSNLVTHMREARAHDTASSAPFSPVSAYILCAINCCAKAVHSCLTQLYYIIVVSIPFPLDIIATKFVYY